MEKMETLKNILEQTSLKWIFVGGKPKAGKTTCSCALAVQLSRVRESVLLVSLDLPHKISDTFEQKFYTEPTKVNGFHNLYAMELDPIVMRQKIHQGIDYEEKDQIKNFNKCLARYLIHSYHGYGDSVKYAEILKVVEEKNISVVVLDTGSIIDTIRFLEVIKKIQKDFAQLFYIKFQLSALGNGGSYFRTRPNFNYDVFSYEMDRQLDAISDLRLQFRHPGETTYIYVDNANPLSLTVNSMIFKRLLQLGIHTYNFVVNSLISPTVIYNVFNGNYFTQMNYFDRLATILQYFYITKLPLMCRKVRGVAAITLFSEYMVKPYFVEPKAAA